MPAAIDVRRGVVVKKHKTGGFFVYMYVDTPGVYYNAFGKEVQPIVAAQAGYDTKKLGKEKLKRERMRKAMSEIEMELELADSAEEETVIEQSGDFRVVSKGLGRAVVMDGDCLITPLPIPEGEASVLMKHLAGEDENEDKKGKK